MRISPRIRRHIRKFFSMSTRVPDRLVFSEEIWGQKSPDTVPLMIYILTIIFRQDVPGGRGST